VDALFVKKKEEKEQPSVRSGIAALVVAISVVLFFQFVVFLGWLGIALGIALAILILRRDPFGKPLGRLAKPS
jgi:hypothetical protein